MAIPWPRFSNPRPWEGEAGEIKAEKGTGPTVDTVLKTEMDLEAGTSAEVKVESNMVDVVSETAGIVISHRISSHRLHTNNTLRHHTIIAPVTPPV